MPNPNGSKSFSTNPHHITFGWLENSMRNTLSNTIKDPQSGVEVVEHILCAPSVLVDCVINSRPQSFEERSRVAGKLSKWALTVFLGTIQN